MTKVISVIERIYGSAVLNFNFDFPNQQIRPLLLPAAVTEGGFVIGRIYCTDEFPYAWDLTGIKAIRGSDTREIFHGNIPGQRLALSTIMKLNNALSVQTILPGEILYIGCTPYCEVARTARLYISYTYTQLSPCDNTSTS